ncbi:hypothetical protein VSH64_10800 [Amycolatopsis rhabdoformis]|uniref:Extradiol ring-cleavage dioxygenase class III enzyme subunit B domain-containing protein n=1 Tax=Amycolatopsis rhabdoformis TaxID=1448059 RepID=A0ABZ1IDQ2_9PSEU|nr:hypothetical protein [Amycolatopsis rhabdoformis]WSE32594.1 hypothetical protein VSH64_10800 [Amycolatopsis rhabdoformis]
MGSTVLAAAVVVPHPPLLVPELTQGAAPLSEPVRRACIAAARELAGATTRWRAVATWPTGPRRLPPESSGTFAPFGVDVRVRLSRDGDGPVEDDLPLPALVAGWLRGQAGADRVTVDLQPPDLSAERRRAWGADLAATAEPTGLLVLGDGSTRHSDRGPELRDDRADGFDQHVHDLFKRADAQGLLDLDPGLAAELGARGRAAWACLGGAILADGRPWQARSAEMFLPFGVAYHVVVLAPVAAKGR